MFVYKLSLIFKVNQFTLKGNWGAYRCCFMLYILWWMRNYCYTLFQQFVNFNHCNRGNSAVPTGNSVLFLNATIRMQLLPKLPTSIDQLIVNKKCSMESFGENTIIFRFHCGGDRKIHYTFEGLYLISKVIPPSAVEVCHSNGKITG